VALQFAEAISLPRRLPRSGQSFFGVAGAGLRLEISRWAYEFRIAKHGEGLEVECVGSSCASIDYSRSSGRRCGCARRPGSQAGFQKDGGTF
jgi:hypothetical protein